MIKKASLLILAILLFSCAKERVLQLPEITLSNITELNDVSAAYLFYDETQLDSIDLNRKNLISTTNWLINVDKRLTLKQAIPKIKYLQDKKQNSSHKNKNAKNYFTCHDLSQNNLGFIEFTHIIYNYETIESLFSETSDLNQTEHSIPINFNTNGDIFILNPNEKPFVIKSNKETFHKDLQKIDSTNTSITLKFDKDLVFQDYISYKNLLLNADLKNASISNIEFINN